MLLAISSLGFSDQFASSVNIFQNIKSEAGCSYKSCSYEKSVVQGASIPLSTEGGFAENPPSNISIFKINGLLTPP